MSAIISNEYREEYAKLKTDPIVIAMEQDIRHIPTMDLVHSLSEQTPRMHFMLRANAEFKSRGGTGNKSIGGVAQAILELRREFGRE